MRSGLKNPKSRRDDVAVVAYRKKEQRGVGVFEAASSFLRAFATLFRGFLFCGLASLFVVLSVGCSRAEREPAPIDRAKDHVRQGEYQAARDILQNLSRPTPESRRLLASTYLAESGFHFADFYGFLSTLDLEFLERPENLDIYVTQFEVSAGSSSSPLLRAIATAEEIYQRWTALPLLSQTQERAVDRAIWVLSNDEDPASASFRLLLRASLLKSQISRRIETCRLDVWLQRQTILALLDQLAQILLDHQQAFEEPLDEGLLGQLEVMRNSVAVPGELERLGSQKLVPISRACQ